MQLQNRHNKIVLISICCNYKRLNNESFLTGESRPVPKHQGDEVVAGSVNGEGSVKVKVTRIDAVKALNLAQKTYSKMIQNLAWATGYNVIAIPLAAGVLYTWGILLSPAVGALLMSLSTVIVAINAVMLRRAKLA
ncbi:hypothetical protein [Chlorogloeopsis fritschii]|uniref:P-type ATPase n=1 Tax=Chlorogloeopsis fritschii TaxID=1124 RepID=UPI0003628D4F|nr:hypothetical protein [Chlorogloeopsis fritschii]